MLAALAGVLGRGAAVAEGGAAASSQGLIATAKNIEKSKQAHENYAKSLGLSTKQLDSALAATADARAKEKAQLASGVSTIQSTGGALQSVIGKIEGLGQTVTGVLTAGVIGLQALAQPIADLTGLSNPAALEAFTRAVNDDFAVVGRALLPITEAMTRGLEKMGAFLAGAEPAINKVSTALAFMFDKLGDQWLDAAKDLGPLLEAVGDVIIDVAVNVANLTSALITVSKWVAEARNKFLSLLGYSGSSFKQDASAKGAAVRDVRVVTSAESVSNEAQAKALQQALNPGKAEAKDPVEVQEGIFTWMTNNIPTKKDVEQFFNMLISHLPDLPKLPGGASVGDAASSMSPLLSLIRSQLTR